MAKEYVLTLTAANRVGILAAVSNAVAELGGDVREINVAVMRGFFTILLSAEFPEHRDRDVIIDHLRDMGRPYQLSIILNDPKHDAFDQSIPETETYYIALTGSNQPGALRQIAARMTQEGVDIAGLYGVRIDENESFRMTLELNVPAGIEPTSLKVALEALNHDTEIAAELYTANEFRDAGMEVPLRSHV